MISEREFRTSTHKQKSIPASPAASNRSRLGRSLAPHRKAPEQRSLKTFQIRALMCEPGETRTLDPRIKSALLYRLSYRLIETCGNQTVNQHLAAMPRRRELAVL
jgi:hypothetical protein